MLFKTILLLVSATLVTFEEAVCSQLKSSKGNSINVKGRRAVEYANNQTNPLQALNTPPTFESNDGETMTIECIKGQSLSGELREWVKNLLNGDSEKLGKKLTRMGWTSEIRWNAYMDDTTYLLIVRSSSGKPVALAHYRFEMDLANDIEFIFLWDLLVDESSRGRGIGTYLLDTLMEVATFYNMRKITLTVFKSNTRAIRLYKRHGFTFDKTRPKEKYMYYFSEPNISFHE